MNKRTIYLLIAVVALGLAYMLFSKKEKTETQPVEHAVSVEEKAAHEQPAEGTEHQEPAVHATEGTEPAPAPGHVEPVESEKAEESKA